MSTGAECNFYETKPGEWRYQIQEWPYGDSQDYYKSGPFPTFAKAYDHMHRHHANPGGYSKDNHPDHKHDYRTVNHYGERQERCRGCDDQAPPPCGCRYAGHHDFGCEEHVLTATIRLKHSAYSEILETNELPERLYEYVVAVVTDAAKRQEQIASRT